VFEAWKGRKYIKEPKQRRLGPEDEVIKTRPSGLVFRNIRFFKNK
jgi:hypothetical protein